MVDVLGVLMIDRETEQLLWIHGYTFAMKVFTIVGSSISMVLALATIGCESGIADREAPDSPGNQGIFPAFITPTEEYYDTKIGGIPSINGETYQLEISGAVDHPATFSLDELLAMELVKKTLTIECIGNSANGGLIGTAGWRGFRVYELLNSLGIKEGASTVKYISADGYFTYNTIEELKNRDVLGALYMNDESIPPLYGFPLRIIFPGYYGVRQPGWIVEIEVLESGPEDFWSGSGWKTDSSMAVDSRIFFPFNRATILQADSIRIGGAAYGARRISKVEVTLDEGNSWIPATIRQSQDEDYVWVFWEVHLALPVNASNITIRSRATALDGSIQPRSDSDYLDGTNSWPSVSITVSGGD
jgi:hypothetical protein